MSPFRTMLATTAAMVAFAANSLLCRQALVHTDIDPASFTTIRLVAGAIALWAFVAARHGKLWPEGGTWISAAALFAYAACFSFAYLSLTAATGALLLFAAVQVTMLGYGFTQGTRLNARQSIGFTLAAIGLVILLLPGVTAPAPQGALLMVMAGIAWGCYSLRGGAHDPAQTSAANFLLAMPMALLLAWFAQDRSLDLHGIALAIASGALTSGMGYLIWYAVLRHITVTTAAVVQLSVPAIAAALGVLVLSEPLSLRLIAASIIILSGIGLAIRRAAPARMRPASPTRR
jgi:drug/metabolite transporter (DMT)-like permease